MNEMRITRRPAARTLAVEEILDLVARGKVRVPHFQRPLRWRSSNVVELFDSVYRGLPIGVLLFSKEHRDTELIRLGPVSIQADEAHDALMVIDGQQRVTALAASLLHPDPIPRSDVFALWFDLEAETFHRLESSEAPPHWIPLNVIGDSYKTLQWLNSWHYRDVRPDLVKRAIALGKAVREYHVPAYIVEEASEHTLRVIFKRVNTTGVRMRESEVFQALYGSEKMTVQGACDQLAATGFGQINPDWFLRCLKALEGIDPRAKLQERAAEVDDQSIVKTEDALRRALEFLMLDVGVHHAQFLPYRLPLVILARFFHLHRSPEPRNRLRLRWWVWRGALSGSHTDSSNANVLSHQEAVGSDESESVSRLLSKIEGDWGYPHPRKIWYGQSAATRLCALAMVAQQPWNPSTNEFWTPEDVRIRLGTSHSLGDVFLDVADRSREPIAGRVLVGDRSGLRALMDADQSVLNSHGITIEALRALHDNDMGAFDTIRAATLQTVFVKFFSERSGAGENDRPSIRSIAARAIGEI